MEQQNDIFCHLPKHVDKLIKSLKTKEFILDKFLDTDFHSPIRFLPESSDGLSENSVGTILP